jgi:hypothetical protein
MSLGADAVAEDGAAHVVQRTTRMQLPGSGRETAGSVAVYEIASGVLVWKEGRVGTEEHIER